MSTERAYAPHPQGTARRRARRQQDPGRVTDAPARLEVAGRLISLGRSPWAS